MSGHVKTFNLYIFDLDDTLIHEGDEPADTKLCAETIQVLESIKNCRKHQKTKRQIILASRNERANEYLKATGIEHYFDHVVGEEVDKFEMLSDILAKYPDVPHDHCYFFDDLPENIKAAEKLKIQACHVNWETGICKSQVHLSPHLWDDSAESLVL